MVARACNSSTWEADMSSKGLRLTWKNYVSKSKAKQSKTHIHESKTEQARPRNWVQFPLGKMKSPRDGCW